MKRLFCEFLCNTLLDLSATDMSKKMYDCSSMACNLRKSVWIYGHLVTVSFLYEVRNDQVIRLKYDKRIIPCFLEGTKKLC